MGNENGSGQVQNEAECQLTTELYTGEPITRYHVTNPRHLYAKQIANTEITMTWHASIDDTVDRYEIEVDGTLIGETTNLEYTLSELQSNTTYEVTVRSVSTSENKRSVGITKAISTLGNYRAEVSTTSDSYIQLQNVRFDALLVISKIKTTENSWENNILTNEDNTKKINTQFDGLRFIRDDFGFEDVLFNGVSAPHNFPLPLHPNLSEMLIIDKGTINKDFQLFLNHSGAILQRIRMFTTDKYGTSILYSDYDFTRISENVVQDLLQNNSDLLLHNVSFIEEA
ncbi:fibronectin type III domain-containing protein [Alkalihalobacterium bogoriense]|uniref:fibronectin type III domain-containing protein n=1 Tax=Alkalihalobacterium bogoriense TaxID=246272 RepID=UPI000479DC15|nr:fibronectin type III domain-containing protein [Alkalihalobacterium bogoriense]